MQEKGGRHAGIPAGTQGDRVSLSLSVVHIFYKLFFNVKIFIKLIHVK